MVKLQNHQNKVAHRVAHRLAHGSRPRFCPHPSTLWEHRKPQKILNKNSPFNWVHSIRTGSMNASHYTNLFTNLCHHNLFPPMANPPHTPTIINLQHPKVPLFTLTKG